MKSTIALILAAGRGTRAGIGLPKTYRILENKTVLRLAIEAFQTHASITHVQVVIHPEDIKLYQECTQGLELPSPVFGGSTRAESVAKGVKAHSGFDQILIHDGARPFVSHEVIDRVLSALSDHQGAIPATPVTDALWKFSGEQLVQPISRNELVAAQTPQGFHFDAYKSIAMGGDFLDDAQAAINSGLDVVWVEGEKRNRKLTFQEDFIE